MHLISGRDAMAGELAWSNATVTQYCKSVAERKRKMLASNHTFEHLLLAWVDPSTLR